MIEQSLDGKDQQKPRAAPKGLSRINLVKMEPQTTQTEQEQTTNNGVRYNIHLVDYPPGTHLDQESTNQVIHQLEREGRTEIETLISENNGPIPLEQTPVAAQLPKIYEFYEQQVDLKDRQRVHKPRQVLLLADLKPARAEQQGGFYPLSQTTLQRYDTTRAIRDPWNTITTTVHEVGHGSGKQTIEALLHQENEELTLSYFYTFGLEIPVGEGKWGSALENGLMLANSQEYYRNVYMPEDPLSRRRITDAVEAARVLQTHLPPAFGPITPEDVLPELRYFIENGKVKPFITMHAMPNLKYTQELARIIGSLVPHNHDGSNDLERGLRYLQTDRLHEQPEYPALLSSIFTPVELETVLNISDDIDLPETQQKLLQAIHLIRSKRPVTAQIPQLEHAGRK